MYANVLNTHAYAGGVCLTGQRLGCARCVTRNVSARKVRKTVQCKSVPNGGQRELTIDMKHFVEETQRNILELNKTRLKALDEANTERQKRLELEARCEELEARAADLEEEKEELLNKLEELEAMPRTTEPTVSESPGQTSAKTESPPKPAQEVQQQSTTPPTPPPVATIQLVYQTGWKVAYVHYNVDNKGWTSSPGQKMERSAEGHSLTIEGSSVEFVVNDGGAAWDKPNPYSEKSDNYWIKAPGKYLLKSGRLNIIN